MTRPPARITSVGFCGRKLIQPNTQSRDANCTRNSRPVTFCDVEQQHKEPQKRTRKEGSELPQQLLPQGSPKRCTVPTQSFGIASTPPAKIWK